MPRIVPFVFRVPFPQDTSLHTCNISKSKEVQNVKHFWSQAFWVRDTQSALTKSRKTFSPQTLQLKEETLEASLQPGRKRLPN